MNVGFVKFMVVAALRLNGDKLLLAPAANRAISASEEEVAV